MPVTTSAAGSRVEELLSAYSAPDACLGRLLCDDHPADQIAFTLVNADLTTEDITYGVLREGAERVAAGLAGLGIAQGDRVGVLMAKSADLLVTLLAIWRLGAVHVPLFTALASPAIRMRMSASEAKLIIVDADQRPKLDTAQSLPWQVVTAGGPIGSGDVAFADLLEVEPLDVPPVATGGDAPFVLIFTSGTTGSPKGVPWPVRALAHLVAYLDFGCDVRADDVYWNVADPGWAYGLGFGIVAPLCAGRRSILLRPAFTAELAWQVLAGLKVTNLAAAPTVYRALRNAPAPPGTRLVLRCASSAGEPLNADLIPWGEATLGVPVRDHYGQSEVGMVVANSWHPELRRPVTPGAMGQAMPGWNVEVLLREHDQVAGPGVLGRLVIERSSPLWSFPGYHGAPELTEERLCGDGRWYVTGDLATRDERGGFSYSSRDDDVILMAGYRIGPFEIESALLTHPDVAEAAVIGVADELRGEVVEAFVVLRPGQPRPEELTGELQRLVKTQLAAHVYPRAVHVVQELPKTPSGKIQRFVLRTGHLGSSQPAPAS